ncbi:MAG: hypothetical protein NNA22_00555 [Nitrospira sp.]|nr:hypothetical protein [Nitrospira sp.]
MRIASTTGLNDRIGCFQEEASFYKPFEISAMGVSTPQINQSKVIVIPEIENEADM